MIVTVNKLRRQARKLDRLNAQIAAVLKAMQQGETLLMEYHWHGSRWRLGGGSAVANEVAQIVIQCAHVAGAGDALAIDGVRPQTWRWIGG
jgi:hypothetical protein